MSHFCLLSLFIYSLILISLINLSNQNINDIFSRASLKFYLNCNKSIVDKSNNEVIILSNMVSFESDRKGVLNSACHFSSTLNNYLLTSSNSFPTLPSMLLSFWLKPSTIISTEEALFYFSSATNSNVDLLISLISNEIDITISSNSIIKYSSSLIQAQTWVFLSFIFTNSKITLYINGNRIVSSELTTLPSLSSLPNLYIGAKISIGGVPTALFSGEIDEISIYDISTIDPSDDNLLLLFNYYKCDPEYQIEVNNTCSHCSEIFNNCSFCYNTTVCDTCQSGFYLNTSSLTCECSKDFCNQCDDMGNCITCKRGYKFNEKGNCEPYNCIKFDYCTKCNDEICIECISDYEVSKGKCILPSKAITGVVIVYLLVVAIIWIFIAVIIRPTLI